MGLSRVIFIVLLVVVFTSSVTLGAASPQSEAVTYAQQISRQLSAQEWLGPIAAIALSPFFGLACLSGIATYGPDWLQQKSAFLSADSPMNNPILFWVMTSLTVLTSLPRFTKISKPISLLAEKLESYSAIVILVIMKFAASAASSSQEPHSVEVVLNAGILSLSNDIMFSLAAAVNLIVINTVKLALEFLVWLIPIPFVDSVLEVLNKTLCAGLAALYAYSPTLASILNLLLFIVCALLFLKVTRYLRYIKTLYIWPTIRAAMGVDESKETVFPGFAVTKWKGIPARSELKLVRQGIDKVTVSYSSWLVTHAMGVATVRKEEPGLLADRLVLGIGAEELVVDVRKGTVCRERQIQSEGEIMTT